MKHVTVLIVSYNTREVLKECLINLSTNYKHLDIIVVDNSSSDGSAELVEKEFPKVKLLKTPNRGIPYATNTGLKHAKGDYILHLGTDAFPKKEDIEKLLDYMETHRDVGICTPKLVTRSGELDMDAHRGFPTPWTALTHFSKLNKVFPKSKLFNQYFMGWKDLNTTHEIDLCISHFMFVRKEVYKDVKMWDEDYFVFGEDVDFCYRVKQAGWKIMYVANVKVVHYKGTGVGRKTTADLKNASNTSPETRRIVKKATTNAMRLFYIKHLKKKYPFFITLPVFIVIGIIEFARLRKSK